MRNRTFVLFCKNNFSVSHLSLFPCRNQILEWPNFTEKREHWFWHLPNRTDEIPPPHSRPRSDTKVLRRQTEERTRYEFQKSFCSFSSFFLDLSLSSFFSYTCSRRRWDTGRRQSKEDVGFRKGSCLSSQASFHAHGWHNIIVHELIKPVNQEVDPRRNIL